MHAGIQPTGGRGAVVIGTNPNRINGEHLEFGNPKHIEYVRQFEKEAERKAHRCISCNGDGHHVCGECDNHGARTGVAIPNKGGDPSFALTAQDRHGIDDGFRIRRLTPTECERLQAFPDGWTKLGKFGAEVKEISDSRRCRAFNLFF